MLRALYWSKLEVILLRVLNLRGPVFCRPEIVSVIVVVPIGITRTHTMPKVRRSTKPPPEGWDLIEPTLEELDKKMREAEAEPHEGKRKVEALWPIFKLHHQKSRFIYDLYYKRQAISKDLFDYCIKEKIADQNLVAKWKKSGFENLCCLRCIQTRDTNFGTNCICRVPKTKMQDERVIQCIHCGCKGCSG
ncbi:Protein BUD31-like protein [Hypsibius exemplaris]|uniref:Protein BUD31 homolog n=1 Tax=Hypsibius exemplaris TaxID=2072580 RepID=A0A1W0WVI7_HYPEX|nr:Protein BUD31-like protein [Hypsibius exemplaris]